VLKGLTITHFKTESRRGNHMSKPRFSRWLAGSGSVLSLALLGACNDGGQTPLDPTNPVAVIQPLALVTTGWDFGGLIGTLPGCQDWGASKSVLQAGFGSILLTSTAGSTITSKGLELAVGATERGLGLATGGPCSGDEVGDHNVGGRLFADFTGVLPAGSTLTQIDLGSVQGTATASSQEGWEIWYSTAGKGDGNTGYLLLNSGFGNGVNNAGDNITITGAPLPLSTTNLVLRFQKFVGAPGNATTDNDYVVKSVTTAFEQSVGCTFTQGYWKNHGGTKKNIPNAWPVASLIIGGQTYTKLELIAIMEAPTVGNGVMSLAQQLIAAKLNVLNGASSAGIAASIAAADLLIDNAGGKILVGPPSSPVLDPNVTSALNDALTDYNEGITGPGHCPD
jgi:hypothetical protein